MRGAVSRPGGQGSKIYALSSGRSKKRGDFIPYKNERFKSTKVPFFCRRHMCCTKANLSVIDVFFDAPFQQGCSFLTYNWKLPACSGAFLLLDVPLTDFALLLTVEASLFTVGKCVD